MQCWAQRTGDYLELTKLIVAAAAEKINVLSEMLVPGQVWLPDPRQ